MYEYPFLVEIWTVVTDSSRWLKNEICYVNIVMLSSLLENCFFLQLLNNLFMWCFMTQICTANIIHHFYLFFLLGIYWWRFLLYSNFNTWELCLSVGRYTKYTITSLEKMHKPKLYVEQDLGVPLDLLDMSVYKWDFRALHLIFLYHNECL